MQMEHFCPPFRLLLQCNKGFFAFQKLSFCNAKKP